jgi:hypothetical protein
MMLVAIGLLLAAAAPAAAKGIDLAYVGPTQLYAACQKAGGDFSTAPGTYGCNKSNCDGKGGTCSVACGTVDHKCVGSTPGHLIANVTLQQFFAGTNIRPIVVLPDVTNDGQHHGGGSHVAPPSKPTKPAGTP